MGTGSNDTVITQKTVGAINPKLKPIIANNITWLLNKKKITQQDLAEMTGISKAALNGYLNIKDEEKSTSLPPVGFFIALRNHFGINVDDFLTREIRYDEYEESQQQSDADIELMNMYKKFTGVYTAYYLDTDSYKGRDYHDVHESLNYGAISIIECKSSVAKSSYECIAVMGISNRQEIDRIKKAIASYDNGESLINIKNDYSSKFYTGTFEIQDNFAYISLRHGTSDRALAIFHCPNTNKNQYIGGIGTINSVSKGREKMPTIQYLGLSRKTLQQSDEEIHQSLLLSYPTLKADKYASELVRTFKSLYVDRESDEIEQSELQKLITVRANMERYMKESLESNVFRYAKVSNRDDDEFYHWMTHNPEDDIDPDLL